MEKTLAFFGAGNMAESLISGIIRGTVVPPERILVTNRSNQERLSFLSEKYGVECELGKEAMLDEADIIILAMKPKDAGDYLNWLKDYVQPRHLVISVIAGLSVAQMEGKLGGEIPIIRTMPNTSALIGESATAISQGTYVEENQLSLAEKLLETLGTTKIVDEKDMHTISAIAGAGPAFFYYMVEAMEKVSTEYGLDSKTAIEILTQTVIGAGKMLESSGENPEQLRVNITSPSGITEAGLNQLMEQDFEKVIHACIASTRERSIEISKEMD